MSYTNGTIVRAEQTDTGAGQDTIASKLRNSVTYQVVMDNGVDGTWGQSAATLVETQVCTASAGAVYEVRMNLDSTASASYWMCLVDKATAPANSDTILDAVRIAPGGTSTLEYRGGRPLSNGVSVCLSTTLTTVTLPGDAKARVSWNADTIA